MATLMICEPTVHISELMESEFAESATEQQAHKETDTTPEQHKLVTRAQQGDTGAFDDIFNQ
jgi:hypothetical protein